MGHVVGDRLFWAHIDSESDLEGAAEDDPRPATADDFSLPPPGTRH
jgi:hypothetical protein